MKSSKLPYCNVCGSITKEGGRKDAYEFFRCTRCGHYFVWPMPVNQLEIYTGDYFSGASEGFGYVDYDRDKEPMIPAFEKYLDLFEQYGARPGRLLDVGAATGFFMDLARQRGWDPDGVEVSGAAAEMGRGKGLRVKTGILEEGQYEEGSFDVITMLDVVEHIAEPWEPVRLVHKLIRPGGLFALNTPDSSSLLSKLLGPKWHLVVPPEHLNLFHEDSLRSLLEKTGFEVLYVGRIGKSFTTQYIMQTLAHWTRSGLLQKLAKGMQDKGLGRIEVPLNLFDNMFMIGRKK